VARFGFALLIGLYLTIGITWMIVNLGAIPHYFDTIDYLSLARNLAVDQYRGIVYPLFLAAINRLLGDPKLLTVFPAEPHPRWFMEVQLIQCAVSLVALAYFLSVVAGNILRAAVENLLATVSFYARLAAWQLGGADPRAFTVGFEATSWTYFILSQHDPRISGVFVSLAAFVALCAGVSALLSARRSVGRRAWVADETVIRIAPAGIFCVLNALAFAATAGVIHIRYVIFFVSLLATSALPLCPAYLFCAYLAHRSVGR